MRVLTAYDNFGWSLRGIEICMRDTDGGALIGGAGIMRRIKKKGGKIIQAYCLGDGHPIIDRFIRDGRLRPVADGCWRVFSQESLKGEMAESGDYIKLDSGGTPYPNDRTFFLENHRHAGGDDYEQIPRRLNAWFPEDGMCPEIHFLIEHKGLVIDEGSEDACFRAPLWGDILSAAKDAVIVFYELEYGPRHEVVKADFNFVARNEFDKTYLSEG